MSITLEQRIAKLEAESEIRQLVARYPFFIDDRELDKFRDLFTEDALVTSGDGKLMAPGRDAMVEQYRNRIRDVGAGMHFTHDHVIYIENETEAQGRVSGHAEMWRSDHQIIVGLRYDDSYRKTEAGWKIAKRKILYLYHTPVRDYQDILGQENRNKAFDYPKPADFPEALQSWQDYIASA